MKIHLQISRLEDTKLRNVFIYVLVEFKKYQDLSCICQDKNLHRREH